MKNAIHIGTMYILEQAIISNIWQKNYTNVYKYLQQHIIMYYFVDIISLII